MKFAGVKEAAETCRRVGIREKTNGDVDKDVRVGNYYVTCSSRITSRYVQQYAENLVR